MSVDPIPSEYHSVTPYLIVSSAAEAIDFYVKAFSATEVLRLVGAGGSVGHAEIQIGDSRVMMADENADFGAFGPQHYGGSPCHLMIYVEDVDTVFQQAVDAGAEVLRQPQDQFYGDRSCMISDPFGHQWSLATHIKDVSHQEAQTLFDEMCSE